QAEEIPDPVSMAIVGVSAAEELRRRRIGAVLEARTVNARLVRLAPGEQAFAIELGIAQEAEVISTVHIAGIGPHGTEYRLIEQDRRAFRPQVHLSRAKARQIGAENVRIAGQIAGVSDAARHRGLEPRSEAVSGSDTATTTRVREATQRRATRNSLADLLTVDERQFARATRV